MYQMLISSIRSNSKTFGRAKNEQRQKELQRLLKVEATDEFVKARMGEPLLTGASLMTF
jgi:hypothetical protein